jgi:hypothetical protein
MRKEISPAIMWTVIVVAVGLATYIIYTRTGHRNRPANYVPARALVAQPEVRAKLLDMYQQKYGAGSHGRK